MSQTILQSASKESQNTAQAAISSLRRDSEPRPMSLLSGKFFLQGVARGSGTLERFNDKMLPNFFMRKDKIAGQLSFFVDWSGHKTEMKLFGLSEHGRSLSFNVRFADKYGNKYNYIALKGIGLPEESAFGKKYRRTMKNDGNEETRGLRDLLAAKEDWKWSNWLLERRIPTSVPVAVITLNNALLRDGRTHSIQSLKRRRVIRKTIKYDDEPRETKQNPVIEVRGFCEMMRVADTKRSDYLKFAKEHGMTLEEYRGWWIGRFASNLARLHNFGKRHNGLTDHNVTLDACFVDNDTIERHGKTRTLLNDLEDALMVVHDFSMSPAYAQYSSLCSEFAKTYLENRRQISRSGWVQILDFIATSWSENPEPKQELLLYIKRRFGRKLALAKVPEKMLSLVYWGNTS